MTAQAAERHQRGTSNSNARGSSESRRRRRAWLIQTYRADVDVVVVVDEEGQIAVYQATDLIADIFPEATPEAACRCYRCGRLLADLSDRLPDGVVMHPDAVTADRIKPGCEGGTYKRTNIRPACVACNSSTGQALSVERRAS